MPALFPPLALLLTLLVSWYVTRAEAPATAELYILTYHQPGARLPFRQLPGRLLAAATTVAFGGSQGFESASVLIGAAWGSLLTRWPTAPVPDGARRSCLAAGASAGIAAVFSSPVIGTLYGVEVPYRRDMDAPRLTPCAIAAVVSYLTRAWLIGARPIVGVPGEANLDAAFLAGCLVVAVACGLGARLFARAEEGLRVLAHHSSHLQRALMAGAVLAGLAWAGHALCGAWITFGPGYIASDWALAQPHPLWLLGVALLIRVSGNLVCVYGGGGGGVFTSLACAGVFIGQLVAEAVGCTQTRLLALLGAACFLGSGYRLPLACMLFVAEASGRLDVTAVGLVAVALGQVLMGNASVSDAQFDRRPG
jgi:CIC family chloride channel protein